jgi:hypothetical protein
MMLVLRSSALGLSLSEPCPNSACESYSVKLKRVWFQKMVWLCTHVARCSGRVVWDVYFEKCSRQGVAWIHGIMEEDLPFRKGMTVWEQPPPPPEVAIKSSGGPKGHRAWSRPTS